MITFSLALCLLAFYTLVGSALLAWLTPAKGPTFPLQFLWLAPVLGMAITALAVSMSSYYGLPVRTSAPWIGLLLGGGALAGLLWRRPGWPGSRHVWAAAIVLLAWVFGFWPAFLWDLNWVAFFNGDMAHFCVIADRLVDGPFWAQPSVEALSGFDLALRKTFHHTMGNDRFASEELIAFVAVLSGRAPISIYMPVLMAAYGTQLTALMALVARSEAFYRRAYLAAAILAVAPLSLFGLYSQLLPQCGGLALLLAGFALLTAEPPAVGVGRWAVLQCVVFSALAILYPEVSPYVILGFGLYWIYRWWQDRRLPLETLRPLLRSVPASVILLNKALLLMFVFMVYHRLPGGLTTNKELIFPHFLLPSGAAIFAGLQPIASYVAPPWQSVNIAAGLLLLALLLGAILLRARRFGEPAVLLGMTMLGMAVYFVYQGNDFGSFKSVMFAQPVLAASLALILPDVRSRLWLVLAGVVLIFNVRQSVYYARTTNETSQAAYGDMRNLSRYGPLVPGVRPAARYYVDMPSIVFEDAVFPQLKGAYAYNANRAYFDDKLIPGATSALNERLLQLLWPSTTYGSEANRRAAEVERTTARPFEALGTKFELTRNPGIPHFDDFQIITLRPEARQFNRLHAGPAGVNSIFAVIPYRDLHDYLVFVHSSRGSLYYTGHRFDAAYYQPERDSYFPEQKFYRMGNYLLFEVINPTPGVRLRLSLTRSLNAAGAKSLAALATVRGQQDVPLRSYGAGSLNVISEPLQPLQIGNQYFIALEIHAPLFRFPDRKPGLLNLYHHGVLIDSAAAVAYGRDISLLNEAEYRALERPARIANFPADMRTPGLEYSGLYEDGWISPEAEVVLHRDPSAHSCVVTLEVPGQLATADRPLELELTLGTSAPSRHLLQPGRNEIVVPLPDAGVENKLSCHLKFQGQLVLPEPDSRPVAGRLVQLAFQ